jgi:hypothetical protein
VNTSKILFSEVIRQGKYVEFCIMRTLRKRFQLTLVAAAIAMAVGTAGGYLLARAIAVRVTEIRLNQYAAAIVADAEASSAELQKVLTANRKKAAAFEAVRSRSESAQPLQAA